MMTLFIDTSTDSLTVSLFNNNVLVSNIQRSSMNEHSKYLSLEIENIFKDNNISPKDINKIMVINGPGSFTGLRIGVTTAKVYGWANNINIVPISTLKAYAVSYKEYDYYISLIDARRGYVYASIYDKDYNEYLKEQYISIDELNNIISKLKKSIIYIGDIKINDNEITKPLLNVENIYNYYKDEVGINAHNVNPNYLKKVEAEEKLGDKND